MAFLEATPVGSLIAGYSSLSNSGTFQGRKTG